LVFAGSLIRRAHPPTVFLWAQKRRASDYPIIPNSHQSHFAHYGTVFLSFLSLFFDYSGDFPPEIPSGSLLLKPLKLVSLYQATVHPYLMRSSSTETLGFSGFPCLPMKGLPAVRIPNRTRNPSPRVCLNLAFLLFGRSPDGVMKGISPSLTVGYGISF